MICLQKSSEGCLPYILGVCHPIEKLVGRTWPQGIDLKEQYFYIGLTNPVLACGNFFGKRFIAAMLSGAEFRPASQSLNDCRWASVPPAIPSPPEALLGLCRHAKAEIPGSARYEHDKKRGSTGGNPPSGHENPELPGLVLFTPRKKFYKSKPSGEERNTENESWNCACN
jgi:hypothetical protein